MLREKFQRYSREGWPQTAAEKQPAKRAQLPLFTKATGAASLKQQQWRARPLTDGSMFPFGKNREHGLRMHEVELSWYRWFLAQPWAGEWPAVAAYARDILAPEREQAAVSARAGKKLSPVNSPLSTAPKSDPVKAEAAFEEFKKSTRNL